MALKSGCLLLVFSMSAAPVDAHDIYMHLKTPLGFHCCTGQDCRPAHYRSGGDGIEMLVDNRWLPVAGYDVMYRSLPGDTGETFGGHWCGRNIPIEGGYITYCAVLPPNSAAAHVPLGTTPHLTSLVPRHSGGNFQIRPKANSLARERTRDGLDRDHARGQVQLLPMCPRVFCERPQEIDGGQFGRRTGA